MAKANLLTGFLPCFLALDSSRPRRYSPALNLHAGHCWSSAVI
jgi:hypothetical protein